jgi:N-methylhydantoinase A
LKQAFYRAHERSYGFFSPDDPIEVVNARLTARGVLPLPPAAQLPAGATIAPQPVERRPVWYGGDSARETPVYRRERMAPGSTITGPAVIDQFDATTVVYPGDTLRVDDSLNLVIELKP